MIPHQSILGLVLISTSIATATAYGHKNHNQSPSFPDDSSSILVGTNWQLSDISGAPAIRDENEGLQGLSFSSEFELSGFDGCNQFSAEWSTVPSNSMITVHLGRRTRRGCGWMTEEQDMRMRDFMGVLGQDAVAYSLSEDEQELTLYTDDASTMTLTRIVDGDLKEDDEEDEGEEQMEMEDEPGLTSTAEYVSIRASRGRALRECTLPIATACRRGETCRRIRFRGSNGQWTTSGPTRVRGVCVPNNRCFPRNVLQNAGGNRAPPFEELARNCCQPNRTKSWTRMTGANRAQTWAVCR
jgi:heat shock protein HslJ